MPTKLPDFIVNRLFLILYFVCAKKLGLKIFLSHDSKCATFDIIVHREIHIHKNGCFYSFSVNIILQPRSFRIWFKSFWTQRYDHNICKLVTNNRRFCLKFLFYRNTHIDTRYSWIGVVSKLALPELNNYRKSQSFGTKILRSVEPGQPALKQSLFC